MGRSIDYEVVRNILKEEFETAEREVRENAPVAVPSVISESTDRLFSSGTQAFREALIGCCLARISDEEIDIRLPYMNQGEDAFNGRTVDEKVVNPFLQDRMVPCSKGPYLSALRRNVSFCEETAPQSWVHLVGDCIADGRCLRYPGVGSQVYLILPEGFRWRKLRIDEINPFQYEKDVLVLERERPS